MSASLRILLLALLTFVAGCAPSSTQPRPITLTGPTMGTSYTVKLSAFPDGTSREELQTQIDGILETINDQMSTWRPDSELSRFNRHTDTDWFAVSPETARVVAEAITISERTGGAFDATVGPLVDLWNFGPQSSENELPTDAEIESVRQWVGFRYIEVRDSPPALRKARTDVHLDLSAIAKGFAVDQIAELLNKREVPGYLVEIGGEVRTKGLGSDGAPWTIGIEQPVPGQRRVRKAIQLMDEALATSGNYRNYFEVDGKRYSHTIDPRTGRPIDHNLASVSVIHQSCMTADAVATALMVLGPEDGYNWAQENDLAVYMIVKNSDGTLSETTTPAFAERTL